MDEHLLAARLALMKNPHKCSAAMLQFVHVGRVVVGMTPAEAQLAGGSYFFSVQPDKAIWPPQANPHEVMAAQAAAPDRSVIRLDFHNRTQFMTDVPVHFRAHIARGSVKKIERTDQVT